MRSFIPVRGAGLLACTVLAGAALMLAGCQGGGQANQVSFDVPVVLATAEKGRVERVLTTTGTVRAVREARLVTPIAGKLVLLQNREAGRVWREGDRVERGDVIAVVEAEEQQVSKAAGIAARRARLEAAEAELERKRRLYEEKIVSDSELKTAESEAATARYDYEQALIVRAQTRVEVPMAGILADVTRAGSGERVAGNYQVARVVDYSEVLVEGRLSASDIDLVEEGQPARVRSYSYPNRVFEGSVSNVAPTVDTETRTFLVEVLLDNEEGLLRPGLFVKLELVVEEAEDVVVVPKDAMVLRRNRPVVFVVERQVARERQVELGLEGSDKLEIRQGLEPGERYVTVGQQTLSDNSPVRPR